MNFDYPCADHTQPRNEGHKARQTALRVLLPASPRIAGARACLAAGRRAR